MKIYNPFKKISKLERELKDSLLDLDDLKRENERLSGKLEYLRENKENHETGMWCIQHTTILFSIFFIFFIIKCHCEQWNSC